MGTEPVQTNATKRMSQVLFDYRKSPLSKTVHAGGSLHAGDRIPDLAVAKVGGEGKTLTAAEPAKLQSLLRTDVFTLLLTNMVDADAIHAEVREKLAHWKDLIHSARLEAQLGDEASFAQVFGAKPALVLVRPRWVCGLRGQRSQCVGTRAIHVGLVSGRAGSGLGFSYVNIEKEFLMQHRHEVWKNLKGRVHAGF